MPPRYAYWTILVDSQPTAFRAASQEDLMPTFKRLKEKHASATMMWFQNGKLWTSRLEAQDAMRARGERGRAGDARQRGLPAEAHRGKAGRPEWRPKSDTPKREWSPKREDAPLEWKPKGFAAEGRRKDAPSLEWKPKGFANDGREPRRSAKREGGKPKSASHSTRPSGYTARPSRPRERKLDWTPKSGHTGARPAGEKRKWIPKEEFKKSHGIEARKDKNWRPGGDHKDPRQKYKDAKKAKWQRFKKNIRQRSDAKRGKKAKE